MFDSAVFNVASWIEKGFKTTHGCLRFASNGRVRTTTYACPTITPSKSALS